AQQWPEELHAGALDEVPRAGDQHVLDRIRVIDHQDAVGPHLGLDGVAVLAGAGPVEAEPIPPEAGHAPGEVAALRAREGRLHRLTSFCRLRRPGGIGPRRPQLVYDTSPT